MLQDDYKVIVFGCDTMSVSGNQLSITAVRTGSMVPATIFSPGTSASACSQIPMRGAGAPI